MVFTITGQCCDRGKGGSSKSSSSSGSVREERRHYDKEVTKPSSGSGTSSAQARPGGVAPGSSKHKPSPAKVTGRHNSMRLLYIFTLLPV